LNVKRHTGFIQIWAVIFILALTGCRARSISPPGPSKEPALSETAPPARGQSYAEYDVSMDVNPDTRTITGVEKIKYTVTADAGLDALFLRIYLNAFQENVSIKPYFPEFENKIFKNGKDYGYMNIVNASVDNEDAAFTQAGTVLKITLPERVQAQQTVNLTIQFNAYVPAINARTGANDQAMWMGSFLPCMAVYDKEGWHTEPYYPAGDPFYTEAATYLVNVNTPADYTVIGPGSVTVSESNQIKTTTFSSTLIRDFAFVVSKAYQMEQISTGSGVEINFYHSTDMNDSTAILALAKQSLEYYENLLSGYPYDSLNLVECGLYGDMGMSYAQVIFLDENYLRTSTDWRLIAHEIGHQWFAGIIGNNQIQYAWLDEGMTTALQEGIWLDDTQLYNKMLSDYSALSARLESLPHKSLSDDISVYTNWSDYYNIQYIRAKLMIYNLRLKMGHELFESFLKEYYAQYAFSIVDKDLFIITAQNVYKSDLSDFFARWMDAETLPPLN